MLVLFDIDGTLVTGGPAKLAFRAALEHTFATAGPIDGHDFAGKTDPRIMHELMTAAGIPPQGIRAGAARFWGRYREELERRIVQEPMTLLPGVGRLLRALTSQGGVFLGLVTGNVRYGARLKLRSVNLWKHFPIGGFGSDHEIRNRLGSLAIQRAGVHWSRRFEGSDAVIVGDTPRDIACGRAAGAATVAVATGGFSVGRLRQAGADRVLSDFCDTRDAVAALTGIDVRETTP